MANDRPYAHAPLVLSLIEFRHPVTRALSRDELEPLKRGLADAVPIMRAEEVMNFAINIGPAGPQPQPSAATVFRLESRDQKTRVVIRPEAMAFETVSYPGWTEFRALVERALTLRQEISPIDGIERIGLRYIDEIRPREDAGQSTDWKQWVQESMLAPTFTPTGEALVVQQQQCAVQYMLPTPDQTLTLRYGAVDGPSAIQPNDPRALGGAAVSSSPHFLIDTDAAWTLPLGGTMPEFEVNALLNLADELHEPSRAIFEAAITDYARGEFNRD